MRVLVFGDSIVQGFWDREGGWVQRLRVFYDDLQIADLSRDEPTVFNLGISGDTTKNVLQRFVQETEARKWPGEEFVFVFAIGTNDSLAHARDYESSPEIYADQLKELVSKASKFSAKKLFVGLTSINEKLTNPYMYSLTGKKYTNARIWEFETILRKFCDNNRLPLVKIFEKFKSRDDLLADGLHPNDEGHKLIAGLVLPELKKLIGS